MSRAADAQNAETATRLSKLAVWTRGFAPPPYDGFALGFLVSPFAIASAQRPGYVMAKYIGELDMFISMSKRKLLGNELVCVAQILTNIQMIRL